NAALRQDERPVRRRASRLDPRSLRISEGPEASLQAGHAFRNSACRTRRHRSASYRRRASVPLSSPSQSIAWFCLTRPRRTRTVVRIATQKIFCFPARLDHFARHFSSEEHAAAAPGAGFERHLKAEESGVVATRADLDIEAARRPEKSRTDGLQERRIAGAAALVVDPGNRPSGDK